MGLRKKSDSPYNKRLKLEAKIDDETEKLICIKTCDVDKFNKKWDLCMASVP